MNPVYWSTQEYLLAIANLLYWSAQVGVLVVLAAILRHFFQIQQPRVLLAYWRVLLVLSFVLPVVQPWHKLALVGQITRSLGDPASSHGLPPLSAGSSAWHLST